MVKLDTSASCQTPANFIKATTGGLWSSSSPSLKSLVKRHRTKGTGDFNHICKVDLISWPCSIVRILEECIEEFPRIEDQIDTIYFDMIMRGVPVRLLAQVYISTEQMLEYFFPLHHASKGTKWYCSKRCQMSCATKTHFDDSSFGSHKHNLLEKDGLAFITHARPDWNMHRQLTRGQFEIWQRMSSGSPVYRDGHLWS